MGLIFYEVFEKHKFNFYKQYKKITFDLEIDQKIVSFWKMFLVLDVHFFQNFMSNKTS